MTSKYTLGSNQYKKTRIIHNEKVIARFNCTSAKPLKQRFLTKARKIKEAILLCVLRASIVLFITGILSASFHLGASTAKPAVVHAQTLVPTMPTTISAYPILQRIADCESGKRNKSGHAIPNTATQFAPNGQVLTNPNKNNSVDIGIMQINLALWGSKATSLHYDLSTIQGNESMGLWIYENRGSEDWYSSRSCWL